MFQEVTIVGRVGKNAEMRYTPSGQAVCSFSVATNNKYKNNAGENIEETTWFRVSTWGRRAEVDNQYVKKGMVVLVQGRLNSDPATGGPRVWADNSGNSRASFEITGQSVKYLVWAKDEDSDAGPAAYNAQNDAISEDDIPF